MDKELQSAIDVLSIDAISIRSSHARLADSFDPKFDRDSNAITVNVQSRVDKYGVFLSNEEPEKLYLSVLVDFKVSLARSKSEDEDTDGEPEDIGSIKATFAAYYLMADRPGDEALEKFAVQNAAFHIWPYWREYLANQCIRMNLAPIMVPMRQFIRPDQE